MVDFGEKWAVFGVFGAAFGGEQPHGRASRVGGTGGPDTDIWDAAARRKQTQK